jgi:FAD/FMN-containing dehydrogenase
MPLGSPAASSGSVFSGLWKDAPVKTVIVKSEEAAVQTLLSAYENGLRVNIRGTGHSFGDTALSRSGLLVINRDVSIFRRHAENIFEVSSGWLWSDLERKLNAVGQSFPVLTNWPPTTVGGTLAFGGYGGASITMGNQAEHVVALTCIRPDGEVTKITSDINSHLWPYALCAAGMLGLNTRIVLRTRHCRAWLHWTEREFKSLAAWSEAMQEALVLANDGVDMFFGKVREDSLCIRHAYMSAIDQVAWPWGRNRFPRGGRNWIQSYEDWLAELEARIFPTDALFIWADYVVPDRAFRDFMILVSETILSDEAVRALRPRMRVLCRPTLSRSRCAFAFSACNSVEAEAGLFAVGVYLHPRVVDLSSIAVAKSKLSELLSACLEAGGRPYLSGWHDLSLEDIVKLYGDHFHKYRDLRAIKDPKFRFNTGTMPPL